MTLCLQSTGMRAVRSAAFALMLVGIAALPASSHSLEEVEQGLADKEKYFQPMDSEAPGFELQDADGRAIRLADFGGKVVVLNFIYASCPDVCPLHAELIAGIQAMINETPMREQVEFVTVTTDPERDTGEVLRGYGVAHGLDPVNWAFLTAAPDQPDATRKLAEAYGLVFTETGDGLQMHGVVTHVIDQDGRLRARFHGLEFAPVNLVVYVNALVNGAQAPHEDSEPSLWSKLKALLW
jgi:protein SCO1/2